MKLAPIPKADFPLTLAWQYWSELASTERLAMRFCDVDEVSVSDALYFHKHSAMSMYYVMDMDDKRVVSEFSLENYSGRAMQIHFSMHPRNTFRYSIKCGLIITDSLLADWKHPDGGPYIKSIYGLTPVTNRAALLYNQRVGFEILATLPNGIKDRGEIVDARLVCKTEPVQGRRLWEKAEMVEAA